MMSRPARYGGKSHAHSQPTAAERSAPNGADTAAVSALSKAHAQYNEPLIQLKAIFPDWKQDDLLSILEDTRGDVETAVAHISEGHAEQWGAVKHKKDKKTPAPRERERDRDGHGHGPSSPRGASSPRGRGRGGRGTAFRSGAPREHRERNANGLAPSEPTTTANGITPDPAVDAGPRDNWGAPSQDTSGDSWGKEPISAAQDDSLESHPPPAEEAKPSSTPVAAPAPNKSRKTPASSGMSWAQITKPQLKPPAPPKATAPPAPEITSQQQEREAVSTGAETEREEPTTVEAPTFDEEPAPTSQPLSNDAPSDDWVNIPTPTAETETDSQTQHLEEQPREVPLSPNVLSAPPSEPVSVPPPTRHEGPETLAPPPGLASPATSQPSAPSKPSTPSNSRPSYATRLGSRWKTDQPVLLPPSASLPKSLPLQFGSLNLSDDNEAQGGHEQDSQLAEPKQPASSLTAQSADASQALPSASPAQSFRAQTQPEAPVTSSEVNIPSGVSHTQAPSVNPSLVLAPGPGPAFPTHQQPPPPQQLQSAASQHTLAGLTHTPQHPGQQTSLGHGQQQSFGQPTSFPQHQQQYETAAITISGTPLSNLAQQSQSQNQGFFRQTDSPFYNQTQSQIPDHGFGNAAGGFSQGGFSGGPGLVNDFGYEGQRNPYDSYGSQASFTGRGGQRQDEVKSLAGVSGAGLGMHQGQAQSAQLGSGQSTGSQNQGQYPGMTHMANPFYYNMNMNPYGYGNQFYSPAFTSFVNPMYQAGGNQTPPHNSKPGTMTGSAGLGMTGNGAYSSGNPGHLHHSSGGFDSDVGPGGTPTYHQPSPALAGDFSKGVYGGTQGFLGNMGASSAASRGPGSVGQTPTSDTSFKGYGAAAGTPAGIGGQDKATAAQGVRGTPNVNQGQQQFYQNTRFPAQSQGYPQQQTQGDSYYPPYQRW